jgi:septal ring factor EnvC (AmiA/AmiB activator)
VERRCEEQCVSCTVARFEREGAIRQIKELENRVRGKEKDVAILRCKIKELRKTKRDEKEVEAALRARIKELNKKLLDTNSEKKEVESARCGIKKKLLEAGVVVSFINYRVYHGLNF